LEDRVILPGTISEQDKLWLYLNCEALLVPSLAEGFGLPVIEAMMCGKPVFLSKSTSLPEIGGGAAFYFENFEEEYMAAFIKEKLTYYRNNYAAVSEQIKQHAEKFTWKNSIEQYLNLYRTL
jgi:glycosyltransferase involved in cell wall biosynthesis